MRNSKGAKPSIQSPGAARLREVVEKGHPLLADVKREVSSPSFTQHANAKAIPGAYAERIYCIAFDLTPGAFFDAATRKRLDKLAERLKAVAP